MNRLLFFLTPVFYPVELVPQYLKHALMLNPLATVTVQARHALIDPSAPTALSAGGPVVLAGSLGLTAAIVAAGLVLYRSQARKVAERI